MSFRVGTEAIYDCPYHKTSNISRTLADNKIVDHSDVVGAVGASPVGAAPTLIFILDLVPGFNGLGEDNHKTRRETFKWGFSVTYTRDFTVNCPGACGATLMNMIQ